MTTIPQGHETCFQFHTHKQRAMCVHDQAIKFSEKNKNLTSCLSIALVGILMKTSEQETIQRNGKITYSHLHLIWRQCLNSYTQYMHFNRYIASKLLTPTFSSIFLFYSLHVVFPSDPTDTFLIPVDLFSDYIIQTHRYCFSLLIQTWKPFYSFSTSIRRNEFPSQ